MVTTSSAARWTLVGAGVAFGVVAAYVILLGKANHRQERRIVELERGITSVEATHAGLRNRMVSTLREPLTDIVAYAERLINHPTLETPERIGMLEEIRNSAREVEQFLADLAEQPEDLMAHANSHHLVLLDHEARSVIAAAPKGTQYSSELEKARAWADSAKVRQIMRTVLNAARAAECHQVTLKTGERSSKAIVTISAHGQLLPIEGIAALTGNTESGDSNSATYIALRDAHAMAADMGGTIGYTEVFGMSHVVIELERAGEDIADPTQDAHEEKVVSPVLPREGFTAAVDLRPERPTASIRFS